MPLTIVAAVSLALVSSTIAYASLATYTRRVHASGALMPSTGLITVASPAAGLVGSAAVAEGDQVRKGDLLFVINLESMSSDGPTQQRVIEELAQDINQLDRGILQLEQQITETEAKRAIEVHAPADGTLTSIRFHAAETEKRHSG